MRKYILSLFATCLLATCFAMPALAHSAPEKSYGGPFLAGEPQEKDTSVGSGYGWTGDGGYGWTAAGGYGFATNN